MIGLRRVLVIGPSWVGDAAMATPALSLLRERLPGAFIGALVRPGIDQVYAGSPYFDEMHVDRAAGMMGPKFAANKVRARNYEAALLLSNSLRTALTARLAGIPRRVGYDRDGRGMLLSQRLHAPKAGRSWAVVPAVTYYWHAATRLLHPELPAALAADAPLPDRPMRLGVSPAQEQEARLALARILSPHGPPASPEPDSTPGPQIHRPVVALCPGGNDPAKRWPADRFARLAAWIAQHTEATVVITGSGGEADLTRQIAEGARQAGALESRVVDLVPLAMTLGALKGVLAGASALITNDTGPRHLAASLGVPLVSLFGPTDHRWAPTLRDGSPEITVLADPDLPPGESANDHPERCAMTRIQVESVAGAIESLLSAHPARPWEELWVARAGVRLAAGS